MSQQFTHTWKVELKMSYRPTYFDVPLFDTDFNPRDSGITDEDVRLTNKELYDYLNDTWEHSNMPRYMELIEEIVDDKEQGHDKKNVTLQHRKHGVFISYEYEVDFADWIEDLDEEDGVPTKSDIERIRCNVEDDLNDYPFSDTLHSGPPGRDAVVPMDNNPNVEMGVISFKAKVSYRRTKSTE